jgi:hypothetical protein
MNWPKMMMTEIVQSYLDYLLTLPEHRERFAQRLASHPPGARAEAAIFAFLRAEGCEPILNEDTATGGADYCCLKPHPFVVEVTSLEDEVLAENAGTEAALPANGEGSALDMPAVLNLVRTTVSKKAPQLANYSVPRVLAICSEYWGTSMFFGPGGASEIMYGGGNITMPISTQGEVGAANMTTDLGEAPFFRIKNGVPETCRKSISALLLVHLDESACHIVGLLHPNPAIQFPIENLPSVPFGRVAWPATTLEIEWMIGAPQQASFPHEGVTLTESELQNGVSVASTKCARTTE